VRRSQTKKARLLDQREHGAGEPEGDQRRAGDVDVTAPGRVGGQAAQQPQGHGDGRQVDREDPAPRRDLDQRAAAERPDHGRHARPCGPGADRRRSLVLVKAVHDQRERARHEQRAGHPLNRPRADQQAGARRQSAEQGAEPEAGEPGSEDAATAEHVAERAAHEQKRGEGEEVCLDGPLLCGEPAAEATADRG